MKIFKTYTYDLRKVNNEASSFKYPVINGAMCLCGDSCFLAARCRRMSTGALGM